MSKISFFITILYKIEIKIRKTTSILIVLLAWAFHCPGQNKVTKEGLKYGKWVEEYDDGERKNTFSGIYKIIPLSTYDTIRAVGYGTAEIKYKGSTPILEFSGRYLNDISVQDSIWQFVDSTGILRSTYFWNQGILAWSKDFDDKGNMIFYSYNDFENNTSLYLTYKNKQLYQKHFYARNETEGTSTFYPDNNLIIQNAEPSFSKTFGDSTKSVFQLKISSKKHLTIKSVISSSENIQVSFPLNKLPYKLSPSDTTIVNLTFAPTPISLRDNDTITIITSEKNVPPYKVYCSLNASHVNYNNIENLKNLTLSKSKDTYLIISLSSDSREVYIKNDKRTEKIYHTLYGKLKIDLKDFNVGIYDITISNFEAFDDNFSLILTE